MTMSPIWFRGIHLPAGRAFPALNSAIEARLYCQHLKNNRATRANTTEHTQNDIKNDIQA